MAKPTDVAVLVGSLRQGSWNRMVAQAVMALAPPSLGLSLVELGRLPLYNQDAEGHSAPREWIEFRERIRRADAFLFVTPEYNRSIPGVLKNAIDVGSRPPAESGWRGKPAGVISVSTGALGAFGANHHLRQSLVYLDIRTMAQPEAYIGHAAERIDAQGNITDEGTRDLLRRFTSAFAEWIARQRGWESASG